MKKYRTIHVKVRARYPKRFKASKRIQPINNEQSRGNTKVSSITLARSDRVSTHVSTSISRSASHATRMPTETNKSTSHFDTVQQWKRNNGKDLRAKKKKILKPKLIISIGIVTLLILAGLAVGIYFLIYSTVKTATTTPTHNAVLRWNPVGITIAGIQGSTGTNASQLNQPFDLFIQPPQTLYITELANNRVKKWIIGSSTGQTVAGQDNGMANNTANAFNLPLGIYADSDDNIYVSDSSNARVQLWMKNAVSGTTVAGIGGVGTGNNQLSSPYGLSYDSTAKRLYIADYTNHRIMSYDQGASAGILVAGNNIAGLNQTFLNSPTGVYFDSFSNSLYIANYGGKNIVRWPLGATSWIPVAGSMNATTGTSGDLFSQPIGVELDPMGNVYVADAGNHRIQFFLAGQTQGITIAGISGVFGSNASALFSPFNVRLDHQLNLYVADTGNQRIQQFLRY